MMKRLTKIVATATIAASASLAVVTLQISTANAFEMTCALIDPVTGSERYEYHPGEKVNIRASLFVPETEIEEDIRIKAKLSAKVSRFTLSSDLGNWTIQVPSLEERELIDGYESAEPHLPKKANLEVDEIIELPTQLPKSQVRIVVDARIDRLPRQRCKHTVRILN